MGFVRVRELLRQSFQNDRESVNVVERQNGATSLYGSQSRVGFCTIFPRLYEVYDKLLECFIHGSAYP